jgi:hypothetical protein
MLAILYIFEILERGKIDLWTRGGKRTTSVFELVRAVLLASPVDGDGPWRRAGTRAK